MIQNRELEELQNKIREAEERLNAKSTRAEGSSPKGSEGKGGEYRSAGRDSRLLFEPSVFLIVFIQIPITPCHPHPAATATGSTLLAMDIGSSRRRPLMGNDLPGCAWYGLGLVRLDFAWRIIWRNWFCLLIPTTPSLQLFATARLTVSFLFHQVAFFLSNTCIRWSFGSLYLLYCVIKRPGFFCPPKALLFK